MSRVLGFVPAIVLSPVAVSLIGVLFDRFILRRFYTADPILSLLVTFGLAMVAEQLIRIIWGAAPIPASLPAALKGSRQRSEEHTSELQSLMRISYAVFCLK